MALLQSIEIENFRCFRRAVQVPLGKATYLIGVNDSGKTSVLSALRCFFHSAAYDPSFLNRTELAARRKGSNRSRISVVFDLDALPTRGKRRQRLLDAYGKRLKIDKYFTTREISREVAVEFSIKGAKPKQLDDLAKDIQDLLRSVSLSYIHPRKAKSFSIRRRRSSRHDC